LFAALLLLLLLPLLRRHGVPVLDSYEASLQLHDGHVTVPQSIAGIIDCLHFCRPSLGEVRASCVTAAVTMRFVAYLLCQLS
jgi:hypothetical protein